MIATAQSRKLQPTLATPDRVEPWITERLVADAARRINHRATIPAARRHRALQSGEHFAGEDRIVEALRSNIKRNGQNAATDIATHSLRIDQMGGTNRHANANISCEVDIGHDGDVLHITRGAKP